ncbi:transketolase [Sphingomonas sp. GV3]|uniref:transketolase n=1 Tax=Sphingomonas sp. GV3 TaxID=3040671 RepID=UPI00280A5D99|nr:transketolase [Sphingomonas sp. GV3]
MTAPVITPDAMPDANPGWLPNDAFDPRSLRKTVLAMARAGSSGHVGCAFSIIEIMAVLYRSFLRYPGNDPRHPDRDYLVLSKGHGVMAQYACMRELGWLDDERHIQRYFGDGSDLMGLSDSRTPGLEVSSGSLGHGFSVGVGIAEGLRRRGTDQRVYAIVGDGELNEGPIWEGMLFAAHNRLGNLLLIVDANGFQAMGRTDEVIALGSIRQKFESFGFVTAEVDGHDEAALDTAIRTLFAGDPDAPKAIVARTTKGKGVGFMEDDNQWHYRHLSAQDYEASIEALRGENAR